MRKKILVFLLALALAAPASGAFAAAKQKKEEDAINFDVEETEKPKPLGKGQVESQKSVEVPAPAMPVGLDQAQLKMLSDILAATQLENAQMKLETVQLQRAEQHKQFLKLMQPEPTKEEMEAALQKPDPEEEKMKRAFPMPGGNPQVVSVLGGNRKALEATLVFPNGVSYEVHKGMLLEGGYRVVSVSGNGVVLEKNGFKLPMPISRGKMSGKPWDPGIEMGIRDNNDSNAMELQHLRPQQ